MKKLAVVMVICAVLTGVLFVIVGCGNEKTSDTDIEETRGEDAEYVGKYVSESNPADFIELRANHTFTWMRNSEETVGSYVIEEGRLLLSAGSFNETMTVRDGALVDSSGTTYQKQ